jgi:hypothetical protein
MDEFKRLADLLGERMREAKAIKGRKSFTREEAEAFEAEEAEAISEGVMLGLAVLERVVVAVERLAFAVEARGHD